MKTTSLIQNNLLRRQIHGDDNPAMEIHIYTDKYSSSILKLGNFTSKWRWKKNHAP